MADSGSAQYIRNQFVLDMFGGGPCATHAGTRILGAVVALPLSCIRMVSAVANGNSSVLLLLLLLFLQSSHLEGSEQPGCKCEALADEAKVTLERYVRTLDLWVVSSGGVGSNSLGEYFLEHGIHSGFANEKKAYRSYVQICHPPNQFVKNPPPILFLYGDLSNALHSVLRQRFIYYNMEKLMYGTMNECKFDKASLKGLLTTKHPDPVGVASQLQQFAAIDTPIVFLKYPFTGATLCGALEQLGISEALLAGLHKCTDWEVRQRSPPSPLDMFDDLRATYHALATALESTPPVTNVSTFPVKVRSVVKSIMDAAAHFNMPVPNRCRVPRFCGTSRHSYTSQLYGYVPQLKGLSSGDRDEAVRRQAAYQNMLNMPAGGTAPSSETRCFEESWNRIDDLPASPQAMQGADLRRWVLSATHTLGVTVEAMIFSGRHERMSLTVGHILPNMKTRGGVLDRVVLLKNTKVEADVEYIDCLGDQLSSDSFVVKDMGSFSAAFQNLDNRTVYVKIDDDTVYISPGTFELLTFYVLHAQFAEELASCGLEVPGIHDHVQHYCGFTANSVNNPPLGWMHERMGYWRSWVGSAPGAGSRYERHHQMMAMPSTSFALNHVAFFDEWCRSNRTFADTLFGKGGANRYYVYNVNACPCQPGDVVDHQSLCYHGIYKTILNFYAFAGKEISHFSGSHWREIAHDLKHTHVSSSDESIMTMAIPHALGKSVGLVPTAIVSHLTKLNQNNLPKEEISSAIGAYREIMDEERTAAELRSGGGGRAHTANTCGRTYHAPGRC